VNHDTGLKQRGVNAVNVVVIAVWPTGTSLLALLKLALVVSWV
jgi:hypothetical protein